MAKTVLILDDDVVFKRTVSHALFKAGFSCVETTDIEQARAAMSRLKVDLMLVDRGLQNGEDGLDFVSEFKDQGTPVIVATAFPCDETFKRSWALGVYEVFDKPVSTSALLKSIEVAIEVGLPENSKHFHWSQNARYEGKPSSFNWSLIPVIDENLVKDLARALTKQEILEIESQFESQLEEDISRIEDSLKQQNLATLKESSHRMAGSFLNFGLLRCEAISRCLQALEEENLEDSSSLLTQLEKAKSEGIGQVKQIIKESSAS